VGPFTKEEMSPWASIGAQLLDASILDILHLDKKKKIQSLFTMAAKPTIFFVPGAWHLPDAFKEVATQLNAVGYRTRLISLPSIGAVKSKRL
jgi:hypothetical protein